MDQGKVYKIAHSATNFETTYMFSCCIIITLLRVRWNVFLINVMIKIKFSLKHVLSIQTSLVFVTRGIHLNFTCQYYYQTYQIKSRFLSSVACSTSNKVSEPSDTVFSETLINPGP